MNYFENYFYKNTKRPIRKWSHYFEIYEKHFCKFKNKTVNFLEIGVGHGGSLQMWKGYFDSNSKIIGLDILTECKNYEEEQIEIEIGSQFDISILEKLVSKYNNFDIIVDDGSHINEHMIFTFNYLFKHLNEDGVYLIEDIHTSYYEDFGGGFKKEGSIMEFTKQKSDQINKFYIDYGGASDDYFTKYLNNISIYDSIIVFEKKFRKTKPISLYSSGDGNFPESNPSENINLDM
jgi:hypothetical protein